MSITKISSNITKITDFGISLDTKDHKGFAGTDLSSVHPARQFFAKLLGHTATCDGKTILLDSATRKEAKEFLERNTGQKLGTLDFVGNVLNNYMSSKKVSGAMTAKDAVEVPVKDFETALSKVGIVGKTLKAVEQQLGFKSGDKTIKASKEDILRALAPHKDTIANKDRHYKEFASELKQKLHSFNKNEEFAAKATAKPAEHERGNVEEKVGLRELQSAQKALFGVLDALHELPRRADQASILFNASPPIDYLTSKEQSQLNEIKNREDPDAKIILDDFKTAKKFIDKALVAAGYDSTSHKGAKNWTPEFSKAFDHMQAVIATMRKAK